MMKVKEWTIDVWHILADVARCAWLGLKRDVRRVNFAALTVWVIYPAAVLCAVAWAILLMLLSGCTASRETVRHDGRVVVADTVAQQAREDVSVASMQAWVDSLVRVVVAQQAEQRTAQETSTEETTELITVTTDSAGRAVRQEQRTTVRTLSRQEEQRLLAWQMQVEQDYARRLASYDSIVGAMQQRVQTHWSDSTDSYSHSQTEAAQGTPWWQRLGTWLSGLLVGAVLGVGLWLTRSWWRGMFGRKAGL